MADTHQALVHELEAVRIAERREKAAIADSYLPKRAALAQRCSVLGHVFVLAGASIIFATAPASRRCAICETEKVD